MPQSYKEYTGSALTATTFSVPFKYLSINDVNALGFDGDKWNALALDSSTPRDATNKTITLAAAPNTLYTTLRLYRATSTTQLIDFQNGSRLSESDLDAAYQQSLFVAQEIAEDASTTQFAAVREVALQAGTSLSNFKSQEFTGDNSATAFNLTAFAPATEVKEAYRVSIDGVMQAPSDYAISMANSTITFTSAPPTSAKIVVVTAASAASSVSVDDVTIGLTSTNKAEIKPVTNANLAGGITQDKLAGGITNAQLAGSIATSKLAEVIDDDTFTTGVSATSLASSESIKAYVDSVVSIADAYPVGSIYMNASDSTNPSTLLGFGSWSPFGAGRVPVGIDSTQTEFDTIGEESGFKTHTLDETEIPPHSHSLGIFGNNSSFGSQTANSSLSNSGSRTTGTTGGGQPHNNLQPYVVVYMWKRTN